MSRTVFYSWQSDSPANTNRNFVEDALKKALQNLDDPNSELVEPERPTLDKDTQGLPGSPAIADSIFEKIRNCAVFVPDLTYIGESQGERKVSNPNVLIEYGLALSTVGDARIVAVMNEAFGSPKQFDLPFDLIHKRWPITYDLPAGATSEERKHQKNTLVRKLTNALRSSLAVIEPNVDEEEENWLRVGTRPTSFVDDGEVLGPYRARAFSEEVSEIRWKGGPQWSLEVRPVSSLPNLSRSRLADVAKEGSLPFLNPHSHSMWTFANEPGFCKAYAHGEYESYLAEEFVQLTANGEIWAVDSNVVVRGKKTFLFPEVHFANALANYFQFYQTALGYQGRVSVRVGFSGLKNHKMLPPELSGGYHFMPGDEFGPLVVDELVEEVKNVGVITNPTMSLKYDTDRYAIPFLEKEGDSRTPTRRYAYGVLAPFFERWWDALGIERPEFLPRQEANSS